MTKIDLQRVLDLDAESTKGPWTEAPESGENGWYWIEHVNIDGQGHDVALRVTSKPDAEFIVLARTALPKLAEAVYHVLDLLDVVEKSDKYAYELGGNKSPSLVTTNEVRRAITDALEGDE